MKRLKKNGQKLDENKKMAIRTLLEEEIEDDIPMNDKLQRIIRKIFAATIISKVQLYRIGELLASAENIISHEKMKFWVEHNSEFTYPQARKLLDIFQIFDDDTEFIEATRFSSLFDSKNSISK